MKDLINAIISYLEAAITATRINAEKVYKGISEDPNQIPTKFFPYIAVDDGGERVEKTNSEGGQNRIYSVIIDMATYKMNRADALDSILDLSNEVKAEIELEVNRQLDSHVWGINIIPYEWTSDDKYFFRGRTVTIDFIELQNTFFDY